MSRINRRNKARKARLFLIAAIVATVSPCIFGCSNNTEENADQENLGDIQNSLDELEGQLTSGSSEEIASAWIELASHADIDQYRDFAEQHGGYPSELELNRLLDFAKAGLLDEYLRAYRDSDLGQLSLKLESDDYYFYMETTEQSLYNPYAYLELSYDYELEEDTSLDELVAAAGFEGQTEAGTSYQQYAYSGNTSLQYRYDYQYAQTTWGDEAAIWIAISETERTADSPSSMLVYCAPLGDKTMDEYISQLALVCENSGSSGIGLNFRTIALCISEKEPSISSDYDNEPHLEFTFDSPDTGQNSSTSSNESSSGDDSKKDRLLISEDGKSMYQVYALSNSIDFTGEFEGSGNFIVRVLDSNQNLYELVANEIGSYVLDTSVAVSEGEMYYIVIECSRGTWNMEWTGTYGG